MDTVPYAFSAAVAATIGDLAPTEAFHYFGNSDLWNAVFQSHSDHRWSVDVFISCNAGRWSWNCTIYCSNRHFRARFPASLEEFNNIHLNYLRVRDIRFNNVEYSNESSINKISGIVRLFAQHLNRSTLYIEESDATDKELVHLLLLVPRYDNTLRKIFVRNYKPCLEPFLLTRMQSELLHEVWFWNGCPSELKKAYVKFRERNLIKW